MMGSRVPDYPDHDRVRSMELFPVAAPAGLSLGYLFPSVLRIDPLQEILRVERKLSGEQSFVHFRIPTQRHGHDHLSSGGQGPFEVEERAADLLGFGLVRLVPTHVLHGGNAHDDIVFPLRTKVERVLVDQAFSPFIFIEHVVGYGVIEGKHVPDLENALAVLRGRPHRLPDYGNFHGALAVPGEIMRMIQILVWLAAKRKVGLLRFPESPREQMSRHAIGENEAVKNDPSPDREQDPRDAPCSPDEFYACNEVFHKSRPRKRPMPSPEKSAGLIFCNARKEGGAASCPSGGRRGRNRAPRSNI